MADGIPCKKCGYQEAEHFEPQIIGNENLSEEEFQKKHKKLFKCRNPGNEDGAYGYVPRCKSYFGNEGSVFEPEDD